MAAGRAAGWPAPAWPSAVPAWRALVQPAARPPRQRGRSSGTCGGRRGDQAGACAWHYNTSALMKQLPLLLALFAAVGSSILAAPLVVRQAAKAQARYAAAREGDSVVLT